MIYAYLNYIMAELKVLVKGKHQWEGEKLKIGATSTLIKSNLNIVVDPGYYPDKSSLIAALAKEGLKVESIDVVVLTHSHLDHTINVSLFANAKIFCKFKGGSYPGQYHILSKGIVQRYTIEDGLELAKDVEFLLSPGHSDDHISLLVRNKNAKIVVAGDAIANEKMADIKNKPLLYSNLRQYNNSRKKILKLADFIVPGHGDIFKVNI